jgi:thioredoxin 1
MRSTERSALMSTLAAVTDETFAAEVLAAPGTVVVDFWAVWCPPCRALEPILEQLAAQHPDLTVVKLDADHNEETVMRYQALSLPTLKVFRGGEVVGTLVGARPKPALEAALAPYLG